MEEIQEIEDCIKNVILKIKKSRSRPSYQNILTRVNKEGIDLVMEKLKIILNDLIDRNIIKDIGVEGRESFSIVDKNIDDDEGDMNINSSAVESFINEQFYETLTNKITLEVKRAVEYEFNTKLSNFDINRLSMDGSHHVKECNRNNDDLIDTLKSEILFLRKEMTSKDKIIELLINDRNYTKSVGNRNNRTDENNLNKNSIQNKSIQNNNLIHNNSYNNLNYRNDPVSISNRFNLLADNAENKSDDIQVMRDDIKTGKDESTNNEDKGTKKRSITIVGDSIIKDIKSHKMRKDIPSGEKLYIKSFSGSTTEEMVDYIKPSLRYNPDLLIIHVGSNDLRSNKKEEAIAEEIIKLAKNSKSNENEIIISSILPRNDNLNEKGQKVNVCLNHLCNKNNISFINNDYIISSKHLNSSGLHLNYNGTAALARNFLRYINY